MTKRHLSIVTAAALVVLSPAFAPAQILNGRLVQAADPNNEKALKEMQSVYVRDSGVATEKLALAERMEKAGQWDKSADVYQEIIEKFADRVVATHTDATGQPTQYTSVAMVVQEKVAKWPEAGLAAYRKRFEDTAKDQLSAAGDDPAALQKVLSLYFPTDAGKQAGIKLLTGGFERGEFALAAWIGRRLLLLHPSLSDERPAVLYVTALAEQMGGNTAAAQAHLDDLKTNFPNALGTIRGTETKLAGALSAELAAQAPANEAFTQGNWPMAFGAPSADAVPSEISKGGARLFNVDIAPPVGRLAATYKATYKQTAAERNLGNMTGILPAVDNGELFFQDNARVYAYGLATGMPLPGWQSTYPGDKHGQFSIDATPSPRGQQMAVAVTTDSVYAVLGQPDMAIASMGMMSQTPQVTSLDRTSGKRNWSMTPNQLKVPESEIALKEGFFYGSPVVVGDSLFVLLRARRGGQFDECHVVCLRATDGSYRWSAYVASTSLGNQYAMLGDPDMAMGGATGQLSYSDGRLFVLTNLGALACLDASDGKTLWLDIYPRSTDALRNAPNFIGQPNSRGPKPFSIDPPIIHGSQVFVMPSDSPSTLVYDAASGDLIASVPRAMQVPEIQDPSVEPADMLLGVVGPNLLLGNRNTIFILPWQNYDAAKTLQANGGKYARFIGTDNNPDDGIRGRPFVSRDVMLVPTADKLFRLSLAKTFRLLSSYPAQGKWDEQESTGNVIATPDNLIVAGPDRVTAYADLSVATGKLDAQIQTAPADVELYLRYAGLLFAAGKLQDGIGKLDLAIEKLGGKNQLQQGTVHNAGRDHLFDIANGFAVKLQKVDGTPAKYITALFDRAQLAADNAEQQVRVRFAMAARAHQAGDVPTELSLNQQVLANADWRRVTVNSGDGLFTASAQATATITQLIKDNGEGIYDSYEAAAAKRLSELKQAPEPDPQQLLAIADEYPVSKQTLEALTLAADRYEASHQPRQATRTLRRLLQGGLSSERTLITLQSLARNYLAEPRGVDNAVTRLQQIVTQLKQPDVKLQQPITLPDGKVIKDATVAQAVDQLKAYRSQLIKAQLPTFGVPATSSGGNDDKVPLLPAKAIIEAQAIVDQQDELARGDRVVAWGVDSKVHVIEAKTGKELLAAPLPDQPIGCAFAGDNLIVVTPTVAVTIDVNGKVLWTLSLTSLPAIEATPSDGGGDNKDGDGNKDGDAIPPVQFRMRGRLNGRNVRIMPGMNGQPQIIDETAQAAVVNGPEHFSNFRLLSDRLVLGTTAGRLASAGLGDGKTDWQARPSDRPIRHFLGNDDFLVASYDDQDNTSTVTVTDVLTGQTVSREVYDFSQQQQLINLAMSPDGMLVALTPSGMSARDLYSPSTAPVRRQGNPMQNETPYRLATGPEQLVITDDKVLAVFFAMGTPQTVRAYDLHTLQPVKAKDDEKKREIDVSYSPINKDKLPIDRQPMTDQIAVSIAATDASFYIVGQHSLAAYNLENPNSQWFASGDKGITRDFAICSDYAVQIYQLANVTTNADKVQAIQMSVYSRDVTDGGVESGVLEQRINIRETSARILAGQWQVADGAFYYLTDGHQLKMMQANP